MGARTPSGGRQRGLFVRAERVLLRRTFDRILVVSRRDGSIIELSGTAVDLWDLLAAPIEFDALAAALAAQYGTDPFVIAVDVRAAIDELHEHGLIEEAE